MLSVSSDLKVAFPSEVYRDEEGDGSDGGWDDDESLGKLDGGGGSSSS